MPEKIRVMGVRWGGYLARGPADELTARGGAPGLLGANHRVGRRLMCASRFAPSTFLQTAAPVLAGEQPCRDHPAKRSSEMAFPGDMAVRDQARDQDRPPEDTYDRAGDELYEAAVEQAPGEQVPGVPEDDAARAHSVGPGGRYQPGPQPADNDHDQRD